MARDIKGRLRRIEQERRAREVDGYAPRLFWLWIVGVPLPEFAPAADVEQFERIMAELAAPGRTADDIEAEIQAVFAEAGIDEAGNPLNLND